MAYWGAAALLLMGLLVGLLRQFGPMAVTLFHETKVKYEATEYFAYQRLKKAINSQDYSAAMAKSLDWKHRLDAARGSA